MRRIALFTLAVLLSGLAPAPAPAQYTADAPDRRVVMEMPSRILDETRTLLVQLPRDYFAEPERRYPLIFVTDADWNFELVAAHADYFGALGRFPDHIVVGVTNVSRNRDFVPRPDPNFPETGGADAFVAFVGDELLPLIDATYRTSDVRIFFGHSFGGTIAFHTWFTRPDLFDVYIPTSASTWVAGRVLFEEAETFLARPEIPDAIVYFAVGEDDGGATIPDGVAMAERIEAAGREEIEFHFEILPEENHFTAVPTSLHRAFAVIYPFWEMDDRLAEMARAGGAEAVEQWFDTEQARLGWRFTPQVFEMAVMALALVEEGHGEAAEAVLRRMLALDPEDPERHAMLGLVLRNTGQREAALASLRRAIALGEAQGAEAARIQRFREVADALEGG